MATNEEDILARYPELEGLSLADLEGMLTFGSQKLWEHGDLRWKLKPIQQVILADIEYWDGFKYIVECSRRLGKSFLLCTIALMKGYLKPYAQIRYASSTRIELRKFIHPIMRILLEDCPDEMRPKWNNTHQAYIFPPPYHSEMHLAGVNKGRADELRGPACDLFIVDEAGNIDDLEYLIKSVAMPQLLDKDGYIVRGRKILISGTPPRSPAHEYASMCEAAEAKQGGYSHYDIYEGGYPEETIDLFARECDPLDQGDIKRGMNSSTWKREYLAQRVVDEAYAIIPEWDDKYVQEFKVDEYFPFYFKIESLDIGVKRDKTVWGCAHYDFKKATLFLHDEFAMNGPEMTTDILAAKIKELSPKRFGEYPVNRRVMDEGLLLGNDLRRLHHLSFSETSKGTLEEMINEVRIWVKDGRIIIHPRCTQLAGCLKYGTWNDKRTDWDHSKAYGHYDALAMLIYMVRNVDHRTNPIPKHYGKSPDDYWLEASNSDNENLKKAFNVRR